jgi:hypothetical protein
MYGLDGSCKLSLSVMSADDEHVIEYQVEKVFTKFSFENVVVNAAADLVFSKPVFVEDVEVSDDATWRGQSFACGCKHGSILAILRSFSTPCEFSNIVSHRN